VVVNASVPPLLSRFEMTREHAGLAMILNDWRKAYVKYYGNPTP
jgi:hypothetical protein